MDVRWCPSCDLPLTRNVNRLAGTVSWRTTVGERVERCPRCIEWLPTVRPDIEIAVEEMNELLAEAGEPPTCGEEVGRIEGWAA